MNSSLTERTEELIKLLNGFVAPFSESVSNLLCRNHSKEYYNELANGVPWAKQMFDASAKIQTGVLTGNINSLGDFDECLSVTNTTGEFIGQHCLATLRIIKNMSDISFTQGLKFMMEKGLKWGYCIPSSCSAQDLSDSLEDYIKPSSSLYVEVPETDCHHDGEEPFTILDGVTICLIFVVFMTVVLSTGYEVSIDRLRRIREKRTLGPTEDKSCQNSSSFSTMLSFDKRFPNLPPLKDIYTSTFISRSVLNSEGSGDRSNSESRRSSPKSDTSQNVSVVSGNGLQDNHMKPCKIPDNSTLKPDYPTKQNKHNGNSQQENSAVTNIHPLNKFSKKYSPDLEVPSRPTSLEFSGFSGLVPRVPSSSEETPPITNSAIGWSIGARPLENDPEHISRSLNTSDVSTDEEFLNRSYRDFSWLSSFSLVSNWNHVFYLNKRNSTLQSLYGIKFLSALWLLFDHTVSLMDSLPSINDLSYKHNIREWYYMLLQNSRLGIDTFFVVTGVIISFSFLRDMRRIGISYKKDKPSGMTYKIFLNYLPLHYLQRFMRLTPVLAVMVLVQVSVYCRFGSGPLWYTQNEFMKNTCKEYWWSTLLYLENYVNGNNMCLHHMWYLMVDMQLYLLSPVILLAFVIWPKRRNFILFSTLLILAVIISYCVNYLFRFPVGYWNSDITIWLLKSKYETIVTHARFGPWTIGLFVGYLLYCRNKSQQRPKGSKSDWKPRWLWLLTVMGIFYSVFGAITFYTSNPDNTAVNSALYNSLSRNIWALCMGWIIFACETNNGGFVESLLTLKVFQPLYRLTYCIYLVHSPVILATGLTIRTPIEKTGLGIMSSVCINLVLSSLFALGLVLFVELPFIRLFEAASSPWQYRIEMFVITRNKRIREVETGKSQELSETTPLLASPSLSTGRNTSIELKL